MFVPEGFSTVTPYLFAADAQRLMDFLQQAFGAEQQHCSRRGDGAVANAALRVGDSMLMVSDAVPAWPAMPSAFYLYVEDADAATARALDAGAELVMPVADMDYGDRQGGVRDPVGNLWWISQRLEDKPYDD